MTSKISDRLTEFANTPDCDQATVLNYLGREVAQLTATVLPALQKVAEQFTKIPEFHYYLDRIKQGKITQPYWVEKLTQIPETEKERDAYLKELFRSHGWGDEQMGERIWEGLSTIKDQVLLAKIIAHLIVQRGFASATFFWKRLPSDEAFRLEVAKLILEGSPRDFYEHIEEYGLKEQASLDELALQGFESDHTYSWPINTIGSFGKLNREIFTKIIKKFLSFWGARDTAIIIKSSSNMCLADLKEVGLLGMQQQPLWRNEIADLDRNDKVFLLEVAKMTLKAGYPLATPISEFDLPARIELFFFRSGFSLEMAERFEIPGAEEWNKLKNEVEIDPDAALRAFKQLGGFSSEKIEEIKDPHAKEQSLIFLIEMAGLTRMLLTEEEQKWVIDNGFAAALLSMQSPSVRTLFLGRLLLQARDPALRARFAALPGNEKIPWVLLTRVLYAGFQMDIQPFREKVEKGVFIEDNKKAVVLLDTLLKLGSQAKAVLERIVRESKTSRETYENICAVRNILDLGMGESLLQEIPLSQILQQVFRETLSLGEVDDFTNKLNQKFFSTRQPNAIITYTAKMKSIHEPNVLTCLGKYIESVLNGTFPDIRYRTENNPHLKKMESFIEAWKVNEKRELPFDESPMVLVPVTEWLTMKIIHDKHIDPKTLPNLIAYLQGRSASTHTEDPFQTELLKLCLIPPEDLKSQIKALQSLRQQATGLFEHDIKGRIMELKKALQPQETKKYILVNTDDPIDLLNCGTESPGSCQDVNGSAYLNRGLLGYLMDGKIRLLAVKDAKTGVIAARTLMKLLWDPKEQKPVLLLERLYGNTAHIDTLVALAKETAARLGHISLLFKPEGGMGEPKTGDRYPNDIEALGGPAPFEYSDAVAKCCGNGKYTVNGARYL